MKRLLVTAVVLGWLAAAAPAAAVEYRLQVASLHERSFAHFFDGRIGRGEGELVLDRLERSLDRAEVPSGALLYRPVQVAGEATAAAFRAARARGEVRLAERGRLWDEVVWDGRPGERSLWVIAPSATHDQEVVHLAVRGKNGLRYYIPYRFSRTSGPATAVGFPLNFLQFYEERGTLWPRYLERAVSLQDGVAVVVGVNQGWYADWVYILVEHPPSPATFKVAIGWETRPEAEKFQTPGGVEERPR
jgi:hypothetical protein